MSRPDLDQTTAALPARALTEDENCALERAIGLSLTPQERLEWLDRIVAELTTLRGLAAGRSPAETAGQGGPRRGRVPEDP